MKVLATVSAVLILFLTALSGAAARAQTEADPAKTLSPYFFVRSDDPDTDTLPLKATSADVNISGVIAEVKITQVYKNEGRRPLEAIYVFPASTRAAVYGMKMTIGKRIIAAKIDKRAEARRQYEEARRQGRSASLLEQQRPNVFQMNVANIMPGDEIRVELKYTELLVPEDGIYEFVYPSVVGPRYSNMPADDAPATDKWVQNPYLHQGEAPPYSFDIKVNISAGMPIRDISCPSHKVDIAYDGPSNAAIRLDKSERNGGNRDYTLRYRLAGDKIESGLLLYKGKKENFFLLMMQPPKRVTPSMIPVREYIFIVDVSGSMHGFPLGIAKTLMKNLLGGLRPVDRFNVLLFSGGSSVLSERSLPATPQNIRAAADLIEHQQGGGGTELLPALRRALALPGDENCSRTVVIATDGYVNVEAKAFDLIRNNLGNANLFAFGIGTAVNRHLIEGMARVGMGKPFVIAKPEEAAAKAYAFRKMIASPVLARVRVSFDGFDAYDVEPPHVPDVLAERPVIVFGKWRGPSHGRITLSGITGSGPYSAAVDVDVVRPSKENAALRYLWARHRIALLSDYNALRPDDERVKEVTDLGLRYNLLTAYTSFVAVDSLVRNKDGSVTTVKQPLPLPEGVSDYAVGGPAVYGAAAPMTASPAGGYGGRVETAEIREMKKENLQEPEMAKGISIIKLTVANEAARKSVEKVIRQHLDELGRCYTSGRGRVSVTFYIEPDGKVKKVVVDSDTTGEKKGKERLVKEISKWRFPLMEKGTRIKVTVSFMIG